MMIEKISEQTPDILHEIDAERINQDVDWGVQSHPLYFVGEDAWYYAAQAEKWKRTNAARVREARKLGRPRGADCAWDGILLEEVFEALAETDPAARRAELIQVAAVAVAMIEHIDRNGSG
jgi:hypothetical protein